MRNCLPSEPRAPRAFRTLARLLPAFCVALASGAAGVSPVAAQSFMQNAKCGVFYELWDVPGAPATTLATVGMAHETFAARDCIARQDMTTACEHLRNVLAAVDRMEDDEAEDLKPDIEAQMSEMACAP